MAKSKGKSFFAQRAEKNAAAKREKEEASVEVLLEKIEKSTGSLATAEPLVQIYTEQDMADQIAAANSHRGYNVFYDSKQRVFMLVTLEYDLATGYATVVSVEPYTDNIMIASRKIAELMTMKLFKKEEEV